MIFMLLLLGIIFTFYFFLCHVYCDPFHPLFHIPFIELYILDFLIHLVCCDFHTYFIFYIWLDILIFPTWIHFSFQFLFLKYFILFLCTSSLFLCFIYLCIYFYFQLGLIFYIHYFSILCFACLCLLDFCLVLKIL